MTESVTLKRPALDTVLNGVAILLGAFLLFQVQPLIAKSILPWFGGSASVWTTCLLFFQVALLLGYAGAYWLSRQPAMHQKIIYPALLGLSLVSLPILPAIRWMPAPTDDPVPKILGLLAATVGLPYLLLSAASPLLQSWASSLNNRPPYRLYALSNAGSMLGLLTYPILIEPRLTNRQQAWMWSIAYCGFVAISLPIALRAAQAAGPAAKTKAGPRWPERFLWMTLAACASALLLSMTNHLTQNIAPIPFLWVLPLSLYLLSLILCFESDRWYRRPLFAMLGVISLPVIAFAISSANPIRNPGIAIALICAPLFVLFMLCHGELASRRPPPAYLTTFYLMNAAGGAVGGLAIGLAAPYLFNALYDPMIVLTLAGLFLAFVLRPARLPARAKDLIVTALLTAYCALLAAKSGAIAFLGAVLLAACVVRIAGSRRCPPFYAVTNAMLYAMAVGLAAGIGGDLIEDTFASIGDSRVLARNFYGALAVYDRPSSGVMGPVRVLRHGSIEHGEQFLQPQHQAHATTYYARKSGAGLALQVLMTQGPIRVGVIGLGAGTLATYARPDDRYSFYEINPDVIAIAQSEFTFLRRCPAPVDVIRGDGRLSLESEPDRQFDLLAVDAFSGDVIPVHLLTREAFHLYWRHLKPDGVLALHITNRYLALAPVAAMAAIGNSKPARLVTYRGDPEQNESASDWVLVTSRPNFFNQQDIQASAQLVQVTAGLRPWTDDYSNLYEVLR
jgi:SAM-dependent methyltransferase